MPEAPVVHPVGLVVARLFFLDWDEITQVVGQRVGADMPAQTVSPRFPALRLTDINSAVITARVWVRMLLQVDCWGTTRSQADSLAAAVVAVLQESANWTGGGAVLGEAEDLRARWEPDTSLTPHQPRSIVTCHLPIRPN